MAVQPTAPGLRFSAQRNAIADAMAAQALLRKQTDRELGLVEPTAVLGGVVHGKPIPQPSPGLLATAFPHRLARVRTQIVQHQMDDVRLPIADGDLRPQQGGLPRSWTLASASAGFEPHFCHVSFGL